jgi:hypothetical protein
MIKRTALSIALAVALSLAGGAAFASGCPKLMKEIDAALPGAKISAAQMDEVKKLRDEGETLHKNKKHDESMAALGKAKGILGLK